MREGDSRPAVGRVVADADVLAADLLVGGSAREALDVVRRHSWLDLVASDALLADAEGVITDLAAADLASAWRQKAESLRTPVDHPAGDHPALASALHGDAAHVLTFADELRTAKAGATIRKHVETSVKSPDAFVRLFDPKRLYPVVVGGEYSGPDRDPRA